MQYVRCPTCETNLKAPDGKDLSKARCPKCGARVDEEAMAAELVGTDRPPTVFVNTEDDWPSTARRIDLTPPKEETPINKTKIVLFFLILFVLFLWWLENGF